MDKAMDTERGGESTQYESIHTVTRPHSKEPGQLSADSEGSETKLPDSSKSTDKSIFGGGGQGGSGSSDNKSSTYESQAEKIRFGQTMSENGGVSGFTDPKMNDGVADGPDSTNSQSTEDARAAQGYGGKNDMAEDVGA